MSYHDNYFEHYDINNNVLNYLNLSGPVKYLKKCSYCATLENGVVVRGNLERHSIIEKKYFNEKGNVDKWDTYDRNGDHSLKYTYNYDVDGKRVLMEMYALDHTTYHRTTYNYDQNGNLIGKKEVNQNSNNYHEFIYNYDNDGYIIESLYYDIGKLSGKSIYEYDSRKNKISERKANSNLKLGLFKIWTYDKENRIVDETYIQENKKRLKFSNIYGSTGLKLEIRGYNEGGIFEHITYNYDDKGYLMESNTHRKDFHERYIYKNDKKGNWVQKTYFKNDLPQTITEREIEYFTR